MKTVTAYACSFHPTSKLFTTARSALRHEAECIHNPETKSCPTCEHDKGWDGCAIGKREDAGLFLRRRCTGHQIRSEVAASS